ncbi:MAG TPA: ABC transporter ATP-binding protein [Candidatus Deferrimicrobiaceae bacterium]|nr:ABC transporter ATP-binding protein [Candidatus Deferrimicrobiaceae bacterium]
MPLLELADVEVSYGSVRATHGISLVVEEGETLALVGSNGAGKTSTLKAIMGMAPVSRGTVRVGGRVVNNTAVSQIVRCGVAYSPEGRRVFPMLSVLDNLRTGAFTLPRARFAARLEQMYGYFPRLEERASQLGGTLSGGEQQMLAIARALMSCPRLFLLDEPSLGLAPVIVQRIGELIAEIQRSEGLAVILAEQNALWAMGLARRTAVIDLGRIHLEGPSEVLRHHDDVRRAYLGT